MSTDILDRLIVWSDQHIAGELSIDRAGAMRFSYAPDWLADPDRTALSQAMPKRVESFGDALCKAVFGGLLPEEGQRTAIARALGVSPDNPFRLLAALGGDVAGALAFLPEGEMPPAAPAGRPARPLDDTELAALIARLPRVPMLAGEGGARLSLAGAQSKLPVVLVKGAIALPRVGEPSTHLIKSEPDRFPGLAANEAFCLALARSVGLDAVMAEWRAVAGKGYLLVTRYDRTVQPGATSRLHQEDFAQALGVPSNRKYASEGGPTFRDGFALVRAATSRPAREVLKLADAAIFNVIIGNADAHAKNYSLLRRANGEVVLAPLYDLVATHVWPELSPKLAMRFGRAATLEDLDAASFVRFAQDAGLALPFLRRRAAAIAARVQAAITDRVEIPGLEDTACLEDLPATVLDRAMRLSLKAEARGR
ncbi:type II toxin-antitoxin system HipA family toxin (plasmid) [Sphingobium fuliginis]|uniref:Type II toxin-antitoxin system HipA family toxin n=1 Tax=Sphingobium fuliginis (strain ATCC 27551) TaxID=336203 RepID=A0A7M2GQ81_SPHSA|nr:MULTISPECIES: type II toxin-antitoxin system HipA family toxin [Sphingobium]QOT74505.1 type II toxin-antitoxin system HipA family toxin [Sphingobium fuliginis]